MITTISPLHYLNWYQCILRSVMKQACLRLSLDSLLWSCDHRTYNMSTICLSTHSMSWHQQYAYHKKSWIKYWSISPHNWLAFLLATEDLLDFCTPGDKLCRQDKDRATRSNKICKKYCFHFQPDRRPWQSETCSHCRGGIQGPMGLCGVPDGSSVLVWEKKY